MSHIRNNGVDVHWCAKRTKASIYAAVGVMDGEVVGQPTSDTDGLHGSDRVHSCTKLIRAVRFMALHQFERTRLTRWSFLLRCKKELPGVEPSDGARSRHGNTDHLGRVTSHQVTRRTGVQYPHWRTGQHIGFGRSAEEACDRLAGHLARETEPCHRGPAVESAD
jgi:hypothetical protein